MALHQTFSQGGEDNAVKFGRKRIQCAISLNNIEKARQAFADMPQRGQSNALTSYLMFRLAIMSWDHDLGRQCVENISSLGEQGHCTDILYACIKEAQHAGDKVCTLAAMIAVSNTKRTSVSITGNCIALLRCIIRLIIMIQEGHLEDAPASPTQDPCVEELCNTFENGESS